MGAHKKNGFTLAELLIVVAIIGVLISVSIPIFVGMKDKAENAACEANRRSLLGALRIEKMTNDSLSNGDLLKDAAGTMNKTVSGNTVNDICPAGGTVTVTFYEGDIVKVECSKHGGSSDTFAKDVIRTVIENLTELSRTINKNGQTQTLKSFLAEGTHTIDSQAGDTITSNGYTMDTWTKVIREKLKADGSAIAEQGWALTYDTNNQQYIMTITTGGTSTLTSANNNDTISVIKYVIDSNDNVVTQTAGTAKVQYYQNKYKRILMDTFTKS